MSLQNAIAQSVFSLALVVSPSAGQTPGVQPVVFGSQSWLGVGIVDVSPEKAQELGLDSVYGVEVAQVAEDGPAAQAGIERGDMITRFRDEELQGAEHLARLVRETPADRTVRLEVWRDGNRQEIDAVIQKRDSPFLAKATTAFKAQPFGWDIPRPITVIRNRSLGIEMESLEGQLAEHFGVDSGVLVRSVDADSRAGESGLKAGDVIVRVAEESVRTPSDIRRATGAVDGPVEIGVMRDRRERDLTLPENGSRQDRWPLTRRFVQ